MATPLQAPYAQFFDSNGDPLSGGKVYTYIAGTTTPKDTYTDADEGTPAANPIILDSAGRAAIWITGTYRIDVYTSADVLVRSTDDVPAFTAGGDMTKAVYDPANIAQQLVGLTAVQTLTNKTITTTASSTGAAGFNVPHGTAPTSPVNGDVWSTTAGAFMRVNAVTLPMTGGFKVGTFSFNTTTATGSIVTTGVGFKPRTLQLFGAINGSVAASFGFSDGTTQFYMYTNDGGTADNFAVSSGLVGTIQTAGGAFQQFSLTTFDNDGFTLANTKTGSPTGTATFGYVAYR